MLNWNSLPICIPCLSTSNSPKLLGWVPLLCKKDHLILETWECCCFFVDTDEQFLPTVLVCKSLHSHVLLATPMDYCSPSSSVHVDSPDKNIIYCVFIFPTWVVLLIQLQVDRITVGRRCHSFPLILMKSQSGAYIYWKIFRRTEKAMKQRNLSLTVWPFGALFFQVALTLTQRPIPSPKKMSPRCITANYGTPASR